MSNVTTTQTDLLCKNVCILPHDAHPWLDGIVGMREVKLPNFRACVLREPLLVGSQMSLATKTHPIVAVGY
jgi:hypothetical protein